MNKITIIKEECQGCCQRQTCEQDLEKCCYLNHKGECLLKEVKYNG